MKASDSLHRRVAVAYLTFSIGATLFFALIAAVAVEGIEEHLVDNRLHEVARWAQPRFASGLPVAMPAGVSFHHGDAIPNSLRGLTPGVQEVHVDGVGLHVLSGKDAAGDFVVVDHESDYEKVELVVYSLFAVGFAGILLFAFMLGSYIGRRIVTPILSLADAVRSGAAQLPELQRDDELGLLARAFAARTSELHGFLDRERYFTGDISHELRTPLTIIGGAAEILVSQHAGDPTVSGPAERILRASDEAARCVSVLLMLARSPERIPHPGTNIGAIARAETVRCQELVAGKEVVLQFLGGEDFSVDAAPELCSAAIGNLVRNACQYTEHGTVVVRLGERSVIIDDTGPGLPAGALATLAGGGPASREGPSSGTGLGLALVRRICEYLGATLTARPREGGGSRFEIRFDPELTQI